MDAKHAIFLFGLSATVSNLKEPALVTTYDINLNCKDKRDDIQDTFLFLEWFRLQMNVQHEASDWNVFSVWSHNEACVWYMPASQHEN